MRSGTYIERTKRECQVTSEKLDHFFTLAQVVKPNAIDFLCNITVHEIWNVYFILEITKQIVHKILCCPPTISYSSDYKHNVKKNT
jgi:hypothetical protein